MQARKKSMQNTIGKVNAGNRVSINSISEIEEQRTGPSQNSVKHSEQSKKSRISNANRKSVANIQTNAKDEQSKMSPRKKLDNGNPMPSHADLKNFR